MKRLISALALAAMAVLPAACGKEDEASEAAVRPEASADGPMATAPGEPEKSTPLPTVVAGPSAAPGAPAFAVLYPGASLDEPAVTASSGAGPGGLVTYTTDAEPDAVITFYRARAEAAGLASTMAMNQGDARAYSAVGSDEGSALQVVASPTEGGETSVQLSWSAGQ